MDKHVRTDPACLFHRPARSRLAMLWQRWRIGVPCMPCHRRRAYRFHVANDRRAIAAEWCGHGPFDSCRCMVVLSPNSGPVFLKRDTQETPVPTFCPSPTPKK